MIVRLGFVIPIIISTFYAFMTERIPHLAFGDPLGPRAFPRLITVGLVLSAIIWLVESRTKVKTAVAASETSVNNGHLKAVALASLIMLIYVILLVPLGFIIDTALFLLVLTSILNKGKVLPNMIVSIGFPVVVYLLFVRILDVSLPAGILPL